VAEEVPVLKPEPGRRCRRRWPLALGLSAAAALFAAAAAAWLIARPREPAERELAQLAERFRTAELFAEAAAVCDCLVARRPEGDGAAAARALLLAAECCECLGRWERAAELYDRFLRRFPERTEAASVRARQDTLERTRRFAALVAEKDLPPERCAEALYDMGVFVRDRMNPHMAAAILAGSADRFPRSPQAAEARSAAGTVLLGLLRPAEARAQFEKLVAANPTGRLAGEAQFWIGHTLELEGRLQGGFDPDPALLARANDPARAALWADLALRRKYNPGAGPAGAPLVAPGLSADARRERGRRLLVAAAAAYQKVVDAHRLSDRAPRALLRLGEIQLRHLKDTDAAVEAYRQLLERFPGTPEAVDRQCEVGRAYVRSGRLADGERLIRLFMASFPNHDEYGEALLNLADCHRRQREFVKALDDYQSYLARCPDSARTEEVKEEIAWLKKYRL
jgi:TolA-binding protein